MTLKVNVTVKWMPYKANRIPTNGRYVTVAKFAGDEPQKEAWSVVLEFDPKATQLDITPGTANFLFEGGPSERLKKGCTFELYEGNKKSAIVRVL